MSTSGLAEVAKRYALALYALADRDRLLDAVASDMRELRAMLAGSAELRRLVGSAALSRQQQGRAIAAVAQAAKLTPLTAKFLGIVAANRRLFVLPAMIDGYLAELARRRGEMTARVTAAVELAPTQVAALEDALRARMGGKVAVEVAVDPGILGGLIVKVGSRMIDTSLRTKLQRLQFAMKGAG